MVFSLKDIVEQRFLKDVLRSVQPEEGWKVLVLDMVTARILSCCTRMHDLVHEKVVLVENIERKREIVPYEAIYLLDPSPASLHALVADFQVRPQYPAVHLFLTRACPDLLFNDLRQSALYPYVQTFKEVFLSFHVYESLVYVLDAPSFFYEFYGETEYSEYHMKQVAEQLASLCFTLDEYPSIRYRKSKFNACFVLAQIIQRRMEEFKAEYPNLGSTLEKSRSCLIIVDRGFDLRSPLLHELTYQAMAYDLLDIENDTYVYERNTDGKNKEAVLDEVDVYWNEYRHHHIADVTQSITRKLIEFKKQRHITIERTTMKDLSVMIKRMPQYKQELKGMAIHFSLASGCMERFQRSVDLICDAEQDFAMGMESSGELVKDPMRKLIPVLLDNQLTPKDKIRLIILYILNKLNGIDNENLEKLLKHAKASHAEKDIITNLSRLGAQIFTGDRTPGRMAAAPRKYRPKGSTRFKLSRWVPVIKDIMEEIIDGKLDTTYYPYAGERTYLESMPKVPTSLRFQSALNETKKGNVSRCIVFVVGGVSYSELRCAYETSSNYNPKWEVIIGGDHILTPSKFMANVQNLSNRPHRTVSKETVVLVNDFNLAGSSNSSLII